MGRHSAPDAAEPETAPADGVAYAASHAAAEPPPVTGSRADLQLLRTDRTVRWSCLGAVFTAFAVYTLVMVFVRRTDMYAFWVWIPIVLSGIAVGVVLDVAHSRRRRDSD